MEKFVRPYKIKDLSGKRFGKLLVLSLAGKKQRKTYFNCKCDCGKEKPVIGYCLTEGYTKSCGCAKGRKGIKKPQLHKEEAGLALLYRSYKNSAKDRELDFELSYEEVKKITKQNCFYCNLEPKQVRKTKYKEYVYNGLDRVDNSKGYLKNNVVACCKMCNTNKGSVTIDLVKKLYNYYSVNNLI